MRDLLKQLKVLAITVSLIQAPVVFSVSSFDDLESQIPNAVNDNSHLINPALQVINGLTRQMVQSSNQTNQASKTAALLKGLAPKTIPAKYFGHCKISELNTKFPRNVCVEPRFPGDGNLQEARAIKNLGYQYDDYFKQLLTPGQNTSTPVGLQCLEDAKQSVLSSIKDRTNNLEFWMNKIKKESQNFTTNNEKDLAEMRNLNGILTGAGVGDTTEEQNRNFRDYFPSNECQTLIGQDALAGTGGLIGIRKSMEPINKESKDYGDNKAVYEHDLKNEIQRIKSDLEANGVGSVSLTAGVTGKTQFAGVKDAIDKKVQLLNRDKKNITDEIARLDPTYTIPELDKNFGVDFEEFTKGAEEHFRLSFINKCATKDDYGVGMDTDQILKSLEQRSTGNNGTKHVNYINAVNNLMGTSDGSNNFISNKLPELKKLDELYGVADLTISYQDGQSRRVNETVYELFSKIVADCEKKYKQTNIFATNNKKRISNFKQVKRAIQSLEDLVKIEKTFMADLANKITDQVLNCEGRKMNAKSCSAGGELFDTTKPAFCIKHASICSDRVNACYSRANATVLKVQNKKKQMATIYNEKVKTMKKRHDSYLDIIGKQVLADADYLRKYFPGSDFDIPKDFFIKQETKEIKLHGESILGGDKTDFSLSLVEQVGQLQKMLEDQSKKINDKVDKYIGEQKQAMASNKAKWESLTDQCEGVEDSIIAAQIAQKQAADKAYQETAAKVGEFCHKYGRLKADNPVAGCGGDTDFSPKDLFEDIGQVSQHISEDVDYNINAYSQVCAQYNNEQEEDSDRDDDDDEDNKGTSKIAYLCNQKDNNASKVKEELSEQIKDGIDSALINNNLVAAYLESGGDMPEVLKGTRAGKALQDFNEALTYSQGLKYEDMLLGITSEVKKLNKKRDPLNAEKVKKIDAQIEVAEGKLKALKALGNTDRINSMNDTNNFCHQHFLNAVQMALDSCSDDCDTAKIKSEYGKVKYAATSSSRRLDKAIKLAKDNIHFKKWKEIGERQEQGYCDYNSQQKRSFTGIGQGGVDDLLKMFNSGGRGLEL